MKSIKFIAKTLLLLLCTGAVSATASAKVNTELLEKYREYYEEEILYDDAGNVYLGSTYPDSNYAYIVSTPDAVGSNDTLVIPDTVTIGGKTYEIYGVGDTPGLEIPSSEAIFSIGKGYKKIVFGKNVSMVEEHTFSCYETLEEIEFLGENIRIYDCAFRGCKKLHTIKGSERIVSFHWNCFANTAIKTFTFGEKVERFYDTPFYGCKELETVINFPTEGDDSQGIAIEFSGCTALKEFHIPEGMTQLYEYAFAHCTSLEKVYIPKSMKRIHSTAFLGCEKLGKGITVHEKNKHFSFRDSMLLNKKGDTLIQWIGNEKVIVIPEYVKKIERNWYYGRNLDYDADYGCKLKTIVIMNPKFKFAREAFPKLYRPKAKKKITVLYPKKGKFRMKTAYIKDYNKKYKLKDYVSQKSYNIYPAPKKVKAKINKGKVQVSYNKIKNSKVKKYRITYRVKKADGIYDVQKTKITKEKKATLCTLEEGEVCEVRVSAYTKQRGVWVPGEYSKIIYVKQ